MKSLTHEDVLKAPKKVLFLYMMAITKQPVGTQMYEGAISEYPEYFQEEIEHRKKWDAIPQEVHDNYWNEKIAVEKDLYKDLPPSKGIIGWMDDPKGYREWLDEYSRINAIAAPIVKQIHQKYYAEYGIEYKGL